MVLDIAFVILVVSWGWRIIGIPPVMYWRKERRVRVLAAILESGLENVPHKVRWDSQKLAQMLAVELDGRLNPW